MKTLVLGIGNTLLSDEGVGVHALYYLQNQLKHSAFTSCLDPTQDDCFADGSYSVNVPLKNSAAPHINNAAALRLVDGGTLSFTLAAEFENAQQLIVIDAAELGAEPGSVQIFVDDDMDHFLGAKRVSSVHEVNLLDLLSISRISGNFPSRRALVGIQPLSVDWGDEPTPVVAEAIPRACERVLNQLQSWLA